MKNKKLVNFLLAFVLCFCTFLFAGCVPQQTSNNPPAVVDPPPSTPDDEEGDIDPENPNVPNIDELFQGIKMVTSGGDDLMVKDYAGGDAKLFNEMLDRQIDVFAQDVLYRLAVSYGLDKLTNNEDIVFQYNGGDYTVNSNNAGIYDGLIVGDNKNNNSGYFDISNAADFDNKLQAGFNTGSVLSFENAINGGHVFAKEAAPSTLINLMWDIDVLNSSEKWLWNNNTVATDVKFYNAYVTANKELFKKALAEILAYGEVKDYKSASFNYNETLNYIDHLGVLSNDIVNIKNFILKEIIGESLVKLDNTRKPEVFNQIDVNLGGIELANIKNENISFKHVLNADTGEFYELALNNNKTYSLYLVDWQNNRKIESFGTYNYTTETSNNLGISFLQSEALGAKSTAGTIVKNSATGLITLGAEIGNVLRKTYSFQGNGVLPIFAKDIIFKDDVASADDPNLYTALSEKRYFKNYGFVVTNILNRCAYHIFNEEGKEAPNKNITQNIEVVGETEYITLYPKMPRAVTQDKTFGELSQEGGSVDPDTGEAMPGVLFTDYQEFKSIIYKPKKEIICPELWLAFSAQPDMRVTLQVNVKYVANGVVLYNNILGSERNSTSDDKSIFVIDRDYNLVNKGVNKSIKGFTPPNGSGYPDVELPDNLKPDPNNRDYLFDFSLYEVIPNLKDHSFKPYNDNSSEDYNIWNSNFTTSGKESGAGAIAGFSAGDNYIEISFIILKAEKVVGSNYVSYNGPVKLSLGFGEPFV